VLTRTNEQTSANTELRRGSDRLVIRRADEPTELELLFQFRYRIYVEEMGRRQKYADHARRRIRDPLDDFATNLVAWNSENQIVGAVRTNFARDGDLLGYEDFYAMHSVGRAHPINSSICTRMMVAPGHRRSLLAMRLSVAVYEYGLMRNITHNFIDCNDHLVPLYQKLGFVQHLPKQEHPEYGSVTCMVLDVLNRAHLERVSSPFLGSLVAWQRPAAELPAPAKSRYSASELCHTGVMQVCWQP
jgi:N-acyl-L-homoserine lactone synthetase